ncbi:uncharacterized protein LOC114770419 isoform X1 [Denticeps clupeoides]|nr:uncharacterized protein LOC114770419 isoform X1 [Denticeps clupeoides]
MFPFSSQRAADMDLKLAMVEMVLLGLIGLSREAIQRPDYDDTATPEFLNPSWMAHLPDNRSISEVTMPGTHNTMALYGSPLAECQSWTLSLQLQAGVRFLDIRVRYKNNNLTIHHGISYQYAHFGDVLQGVANFLQQHPSEMVLMRLREELSETGDIYHAVVRYIHQYASWDMLWHSRRVPTVGEARGKLIILQDFPGPALGMYYRSLDIADDWKVPSLDHAAEKWTKVYSHLEKATKGDKTLVFLTYTSGASIQAWPYALARRINPLLYDYLTARAGQTRRLGIITSDYPAAPLLNATIHFNYGGSTTPTPSTPVTHL